MLKTMMVVASLAAFAYGNAAQAATLVYNVDAAFKSGGSVKGTLTLNNTTGLFTAANLTAAGFGTGNGVNNVIVFQGPGLFGGTELDVANYMTGSEPEFNFTASSFNSYMASSIGVSSFYYNTGNVNFNEFSSAISVTLATPMSTSAVPEAATWAMLMIGMGIAGGALRRRRISTRVSFA